MRVWAGVDAGKGHHHCVVIDEQGRRLLSRRVANEEPELLALMTDVLALGDEVTWAIDLADGAAALLITLLADRDQHLLYIPGRTVNRAAEGYRGEGKTDAKDAAVIADQARLRRDLHPPRAGDELAVELKILTTRRLNLAADRTRLINRLRGLLTGIFPGLEQRLDLANQGPPVLLTKYQTPADLRSAGADRVETWLRRRGVRNAARLAEAAVTAAQRQLARVPGQEVTGQIIQHLAEELVALNAKIAEMDKLIEERFCQHEHAEVITSMPGIGTLLGAEFVAATGGDLAAFGTPDRLAVFAGLAPAPRDSGKVSGNPAPAPPLQPASATRLLYLGADQHPVLRSVPTFL